MNSPIDVIKGFEGKKVLVVGDAILDIYERGWTNRLCREAPAPVVMLEERVHSCGGAANTAVNTRALGGEVSFLTVIGDDPGGEKTMALLQRNGVDTRLAIRSSSRKTIVKKRVCASSSILVRVDEGSTDAISDSLSGKVLESIRHHAPDFDVIVFSDYGYGLFTEQVLAGLEGADLSKPLVVDAKRPDRFRSLAPTVAKPNYEESIRMLDLPARLHGSRTEQMLAHGQNLLDRTGASFVTATLDMDGTILFERSRDPYLVSCVPQADKRTVGAGDSFIGALALAVAGNVPPRVAARVAAAAAAVVIKKDGTEICTNEELCSSFHRHDKRIFDHARLVREVDSFRRRNQRIVFTNGCFDILHRGHVEFLNEAKMLGDVLIVALNTDAGIRRIKGAGRPVNRLEDRMEVLAGLEAVDLLVAFDGDSPLPLIRSVRPDVFAKGGTYSIHSLPEAEAVRKMGGEVEIIPVQTSLSTSGLIERIQRPVGNGQFANGRRAL